MMKVASPEATMLMAAADVAVCAGLDNVATIAVELAEGRKQIERRVLAAARLSFASALRRLGWMLERFAGLCLDALAEWCRSLDASLSVLAFQARRRGVVGLALRGGTVFNKLFLDEPARATTA